jgi:hypothetical protein
LAPDLAPRLKDVRYQFAQARQFQLTKTLQREFNLGEAMLYLLVLILIGEMILAWSCSYHPPAAAKAVAGRPAWNLQRGAA